MSKSAQTGLLIFRRFSMLIYNSVLFIERNGVQDFENGYVCLGQNTEVAVYRVEPARLTDAFFMILIFGVNRFLPWDE